MAFRGLQTTTRLSRRVLPAVRKARFATLNCMRMHPNLKHAVVPVPGEYQSPENTEYLSGYKWGGYHPVHIGDRLNGRYRVVNKISFDRHSTSWLALDEKVSKYVSVKVGTINVNWTEDCLLPELAQNTSADFNSRNTPELIAAPLDRFILRGPNGIHPCLVTVPTRCSLQEVKGDPFDSNVIQLDVTRSLVAQLVIAVSKIHSKGYAHGGGRPYSPSPFNVGKLADTGTIDLHLGNILLRFPPSVDILSKKQLYARYGEPDKKPTIRGDIDAQSTDSKIPSYLLKPMGINVSSDKITLCEAGLILSGFGAVFRPAEKSRFESRKPLYLRPPEVFFEQGTPLTLASDIWDMGCVIFELFGESPLINGLVVDGRALAPQHYITAQQVHLLGPMPREWWGRWEERPCYFDDSGVPFSNSWEIRTWARLRHESVLGKWHRMRLGGRAPWEAGEWDALLRLLKWMLAWRPAGRPTALQVLETEWMKKWALPAYRKTLRLQERRGRQKFSRRKCKWITEVRAFEGNC